MRGAVVDVAVAIVRDERGRVLLAQRTARQVAAGYWELPGGKIDPGETPRDAAARELLEETGIEARTIEPWVSYVHAFPTKRVRLHFFCVLAWSGTPHGREGQRVAWVDPSAPEVAPILESNDRVLFGLGLPASYRLTNASANGGPEAFLRDLPGLLAGGERFFGVCEPEMIPDQRVAFARRVAAIVRPYGARVLLCGSALEARRAGADGVHSSAVETSRLTSRPPVRFWAATCSGAADLARASELGADAAVLPKEFPGPPPHATLPVYASAGSANDRHVFVRR